MSVFPPFKFDGYTVRKVEEKDRNYLNLLTEADDYHRGRMDADFFLDLQPGEDAWALEDEEHRIVFYFKTSTVVRIAIQFADWGSHRATRRNQSALASGLHWLKGVLRHNSFTELIFDSEGRELQAFAARRLGFRLSPTLTLPLTQPRGAGTVPTSIAGEGVRGDVRGDTATTGHFQ